MSSSLLNQLVLGSHRIRAASLNLAGSCIAGGLHLSLPPQTIHPASLLYVFEKLAFRTENCRNRISQLVGSVQASRCSREAVLYAGATVSEQSLELYSILLDNLKDTFNTFSSSNKREDVNAIWSEIKQIAAYEVQELFRKPDLLVPELLHAPSFHLQTDQHTINDPESLLAVPKQLETLNISDMQSMMQQVSDSLSNSLVVAGAGVSSSCLQSLSTKLDSLSTPKTASHKTKNTDTKPFQGNQAQYIEANEEPFVHMAIAFAGPTLSETSAQDACVYAVMQMLLGGGDAFSAGGPGKGMYSRLYQDVLNRHHWVESCKVITNSYLHRGLFGIHASGAVSHAKELAQMLVSQFKRLANDSNRIPIEDFDRAKAQVKSALLMGLESRLCQVQQVAEQLYSNQTIHSSSALCQMVDAVQRKDLDRIVHQMMMSDAKKPAVIAYGPIANIPTYHQILQWLQ